jgi:hypothetical protein
MKAYSLLVGARNKQRRFSRRDEGLLKTVTARYFPAGFTILDASGAWFEGGKTSIRREQARQVLVCTSRPRQLKPWCLEVGRVFAQKEVLLLELGEARRFPIKRDAVSVAALDKAE